MVTLPEGPYPRLDIEAVRARDREGRRMTFWYALWTVGHAPSSLEVGGAVEPGAAVLQGPLRFTHTAAKEDAAVLEAAARAAHDVMLARVRAPLDTSGVSLDIG